MPYVGAFGVCLVVLLLLGLCERVFRDRARMHLPIRIHVNGTRGKSTVTRLIWAALQEASVPTVAKTTGTAPRVLLPDGSERPVRRLGPSNIHEQLWLLRLAHRTRARAVVAECMAIRPDLQSTEGDMIAATIGVITNVRLDHIEVMGRTLPDIAASLANTIPRRGVLVTGDAAFAPLFRTRAAALGTRVVVATAHEAADRPASESAVASGLQGRSPITRWLAEDQEVALAVTRELGISDEIALAGMSKAPADPGAARLGVTHVAGRQVPYLDATAANDPESLTRLLSDLYPLFDHTDGIGGRTANDFRGLLVVFNHRADRPDRLRLFASGSRSFGDSQSVIITGEWPSWPLWRRARRARRGRPLRFVHVSRVAEVIAQQAVDASGLLFCGNTRGLDVRGILGRVASGG